MKYKRSLKFNMAENKATPKIFTSKCHLTCWTCNRKISPGDKYIKMGYVAYKCLPCAKIFIDRKYLVEYNCRSDPTLSHYKVIVTAKTKAEAVAIAYANCGCFNSFYPGHWEVSELPGTKVLSKSSITKEGPKARFASSIGSCMNWYKD